MRPDVPPEQVVLDERAVAEMLGISHGALAQDRLRGRSPRWVRVGGRRVRYRLSDVLAYLDEQTMDGADPSPVKRNRSAAS